MIGKNVLRSSGLLPKAYSGLTSSGTYKGPDATRAHGGLHLHQCTRTGNGRRWGLETVRTQRGRWGRSLTSREADTGEITLAYAVSASNTLDQLGLDPGSSLEISYRA